MAEIVLSSPCGNIIMASVNLDDSYTANDRKAYWYISDDYNEFSDAVRSGLPDHMKYVPGGASSTSTSFNKCKPGTMYWVACVIYYDDGLNSRLFSGSITTHLYLYPVIKSFSVSQITPGLKEALVTVDVSDLAQHEIESVRWLNMSITVNGYCKGDHAGISGVNEFNITLDNLQTYTATITVVNGGYFKDGELISSGSELTATARCTFSMNELGQLTNLRVKRIDDGDSAGLILTFNKPSQSLPDYEYYKYYLNIDDDIVDESKIPKFTINGIKYGHELNRITIRADVWSIYDEFDPVIQGEDSFNYPCTTAPARPYIKSVSVSGGTLSVHWGVANTTNYTKMYITLYNKSGTRVDWTTYEEENAPVKRYNAETTITTFTGIAPGEYYVKLMTALVVNGIELNSVDGYGNDYAAQSDLYVVSDNPRPVDWSWVVSNGNATTLQTQNAYKALTKTNNFVFANFEAAVWDDFINKVIGFLKYTMKYTANIGEIVFGYSATTKYADMIEDARTDSTNKLTAQMFNIVRYCIGSMNSFGSGTIANGTAVATAKQSGDIVYGEYIIKFAQKLNQIQ